MITRARAITVAVAILAAMGAAIPTAYASLLLPGMLIVAPAEPDPTGGILVQSTGPLPFSSELGAGSGTLESRVYSGDPSNSLGGYTFTYQITNDLGSELIYHLLLTPFAAFTTDVSYQLAPGAALPLSVHRSVDGSVVGFNFVGSPEPLFPGLASSLLVVQTNAQARTSGIATVIYGSADVTGVPTLVPVPEPATLTVLAVGIAGALLGRRRQA